MEATYKSGQDVNIQGATVRITDAMPIKHGEEAVDFVYELDGRELWQATETEMERLVSGEWTLRDLELQNDV